MRFLPREADFSSGLNLGLLGLIAWILGGYIVGVSTAAPDEFTGLTEVTLVQLASVLPVALGTVLYWVGAGLTVGAPLVFWFGWPVYLRLTD